MHTNRFVFFNPDARPEIYEEFTGCSSNGFSTMTQCVPPIEKGFAIWEHELPGEVFSGTYQDVLQRLSLLSFSPQTGIVLYKRATGFEDFLGRLVDLCPNTPFIGGGAAFSGDMQEGKLLPDAEDVCVLAVSAKNYRVEKLNLFDDLHKRLEIAPASNRSFGKIRELPDGKWQNAVSYFREKQAEWGIDITNFENLCFCDRNRRNLHCRVADGNIFAGANLPEDRLLFLNYVSSEKATERLSHFLDDTNSLIFGCAGIRSIVHEPFYTGKGSLAGFMFGEVVTCGEQAELGNLMLTKLKRLMRSV